jgi:hypothetical protein
MDLSPAPWEMTMNEIDITINVNRLKSAIQSEMDVAISDQMAQNIVAKMHGYKDWGDIYQVLKPSGARTLDFLDIVVQTSDDPSQLTASKALKTLWDHHPRAMAHVEKITDTKVATGAIVAICGYENAAKNCVTEAIMKHILESDNHDDKSFEVVCVSGFSSLIKLNEIIGSSKKIRSTVTLRQGDIDHIGWLMGDSDPKVLILNAKTEADIQLSIAMAHQGHKVLCVFENVSAKTAFFSFKHTAHCMTEANPRNVGKESLQTLIAKDRLVILQHRVNHEQR